MQRKNIQPDTLEFKAVCRNCHGGCGTIVRTQNGVVTEVIGDPANPINRGKLCVKAGISTIEQLYHLDRLDYPLVRTGARGEGKWRRTSWDEASKNCSISEYVIRDCSSRPSRSIKVEAVDPSHEAAVYACRPLGKTRCSGQAISSAARVAKSSLRIWPEADDDATGELPAVAAEERLPTFASCIRCAYGAIETALKLP